MKTADGAHVVTWDDGLLEVPTLPPARRAPGQWVVRRRLADQALLEWLPRPGAWLRLIHSRAAAA